jgi:hypothetical protein
MRQMLEAEGITFGANERVDLKRYGWDPGRDLSPEELDTILAGVTTNTMSVSDNLMHLLQDDPASPFRIQPPEAGT